MSSDKKSTSQEKPSQKVWTWEDTYRSHLDWCNMHISCIVCNIEKERSLNLHKSMDTLTLDAIENHFMLQEDTLTVDAIENNFVQKEVGKDQGRQQ